MTTVLDIRGLSISFGAAADVVHDLSFQLSAGKTLAIVGESGSGKSVSSLAIMGLLDKTANIRAQKLEFNGQDISAFTDDDFRPMRGKQMSMIFQEPMTSLNPAMRCGKQVAESLQLHDGMSFQEARAKTIEWFGKVKLPQPEAVFEKYPHQLSGGQRQRVMIALAMCTSPKLLIADEPTTALDVTVQKEILQLLRELQRDTGMAMIFITHDLGVVQEIADDVLVMFRGTMQEYGATKQVIERPTSNYTKGLLACRPPLDKKPKRLPTVQEFLKPQSTKDVGATTGSERPHPNPPQGKGNAGGIEGSCSPVGEARWGSVQHEQQPLPNPPQREGNTGGIEGSSSPVGEVKWKSEQHEQQPHPNPPQREGNAGGIEGSSSPAGEVKWKSEQHEQQPLPNPPQEKGNAGGIEGSPSPVGKAKWESEQHEQQPLPNPSQGEGNAGGMPTNSSPVGEVGRGLKNIQQPSLSTINRKLLTITDLHKFFPLPKTSLFGKIPRVEVLKGISFDVFRGETVGLVGESGCGKSTLGRNIIRLLEPEQGQIVYKGQDITRLKGSSLRKLRKEIQIIFQDPYSSLNPKQRIGEAITEPMLVHGLHGSAKARVEKAKSLLDKVGLGAEHFDRYPHEFSGGQRQRIGIARALALEPELIICDESVSALDVSVQAQVLNVLNDLKDEYGLTYIFISHDLSVVKYFSDRVAVMNNGRIVELNTSEEIYRSPQDDYTKKLLASIPAQ